MKRILTFILSAVLIVPLPVALAAPTQIGGEQINRLWRIGTSVIAGLAISGQSGDNAKPAFRVLHPTGPASFNVTVRGGQYMTGGLIINLGGVNGTGATVDSGLALEIIGVGSGRVLHAQDSLRSSGTLIVEGAANIQGALTLATMLTVANGGSGFSSCTDGGAVFGNGTSALNCDSILSDDQVYIGDGTTEPTATTLPSCSAAGDTLNYNSSTNAWACGTDSDTTYTVGQGLTMTSTVLSLSSSFSGSSLEIAGVSSGRILHAQDQLRSSGSLIVEGASALEGNVTVTGTVNATDLTCSDCLAVGDLGANSVDASELVATAVTLGSYGSATQVATFTVDADGRLTAAANTTIAGLGGANLTDDSLDFVDLEDTLDLDANLSLNSAGFTTRWNDDGNAAGDFTIEGDTDANLFVSDASADKVGFGTATPETKIEVIGTASGRTLHAQDQLQSSGSLSIESTSMFQNNVSVRGTLSGLVLNVMGANASYIIGNTRFGDTTAAKTKLDVLGTISGSALVVNGTTSVVGHTYTWPTTQGSSNQVLTNNGSDTLSWTTPPGSSYTAGQGLTLVGTSFKTNATLTGTTLRGWTTVSGATIIGGPGTVSAPSHTFAGDTNTGLYWISADIMGIATAGVERVRIDASGNIGVGTTVTASNKFNVGGTMSGYTVLIGDGAVGTPSLSFGADTNTGLYWIGADILGVATGGAERMRIDASGNVGIGTTVTANAKLNVGGTMSGSSIVTSNSLGTNSITGTNTTISGSLAVRKARISRIVEIPLCDAATACAVGSGAQITIPNMMDQMTLSGAWISAAQPGTTNTTRIQLWNITKQQNIFSTGPGLQSGLTFSGTYTLTTTPTVVNMKDIWVPRITGVSTTPPKGLTLQLLFAP